MPNKQSTWIGALYSTPRAGQGPLPGVSMIVKFGQYLYSILTTISLAQNCCSRSSRAFSFSMYSCAQRLWIITRCTTPAAHAESSSQEHKIFFPFLGASALTLHLF